MPMFDVIVVGARCADAPTAMLLARHGHRVLLVDRSRFPSDIPHGFFIPYTRSRASPCVARSCRLVYRRPRERLSQRGANTVPCFNWLT